MRNGKEQFPELVEKRTGKIIFLAVSERIPLVAPPAIPAVHRIFLVRRDARNHFLAAEPALPLIERPFVPEGNPALFAAFNAKRRRRNLDLLVESEIIWLNDETLFTVLATFGLRIHK